MTKGRYFVHKHEFYSLRMCMRRWTQVFFWFFGGRLKSDAAAPKTDSHNRSVTQSQLTSIVYDFTREIPFREVVSYNKSHFNSLSSRWSSLQLNIVIKFHFTPNKGDGVPCKSAIYECIWNETLKPIINIILSKLIDVRSSGWHTLHLIIYA